MWTDLLAMIAAFGCVVSSGITLVIFFPRSIEGEIVARDALKESRRRHSPSMKQSMMDTGISTSQHVDPDGYLLTSSPSRKFTAEMEDDILSPGQAKGWIYDREDRSPGGLPPPALTPIPARPSRRRSDGAEMVGLNPGALSEQNVSRHNLRMSNVNPLVHNFTSPIDLAYGPRPTQPHPYSFAANA